MAGKEGPMDAREAGQCWSRMSLHIPGGDTRGFYCLPDFPEECWVGTAVPGFLWFRDSGEALDLLGWVAPANCSGEFGLAPADQQTWAELVEAFLARKGEPMSLSGRNSAKA